VRSLSLAGADRFQDHKLLAEKNRFGLTSRMRSEQSDEQSAEQLQEVKHPKARIVDRGICASPDTIFGSHRVDKTPRSLAISEVQCQQGQALRYQQAACP
jgi:hypothetical protein